MSNQRKSNFELLRIVSIVMIVFHHYSLNVAQMDIWEGISVNKLFFEFIYCFSQVGVNCFVLITGYFMFDKTNDMFFWRRVTKLVFQTKVYAFTLFVISVLMGAVDFSINNFLSNIFPIITGRYWSVSTYIALYLLIPYINNIFASSNDKQIRCLISILFIFNVILPTISINYFFSNLSWFILLYLSAAYYAIRKRSFCLFTRTKMYLLTAVLLFLTLFASVVIMDLMGVYINPLFGKIHYLLTPGRKLLPIMVSCFLFLYFEGLTIKNNRMINSIAGCTIGVYLFHSGSGEKIFWNYLLNCGQFNRSVYLPIITVGFVALMYLMGIVSHYFYRYTENIIFEKFECHIAQKLEKFFN